MTDRQPHDGPPPHPPGLTDKHLAEALLTLGSSPPAGDRVVLRVLSGSSAGCGAELIHSLVLGQASVADLVLTDPGLSRQHARVTRLRDNRLELQDLGSANGTLVDGCRIDRHMLTEGQSFFLGCLPEHGRLGVEVSITRSPVTPADVARVRGNRAAARFREGDLSGAIEEATAALALHPELADAYATRGAARRLNDDPSGALQDCSRAIELQPEVAGFHWHRAEAHRRLGDPAAAIAACDRALELNPVLPDAWACRGEARRVLGDATVAARDCARAIELNPKLVSAWATRARAREALGDAEQAASDYRRVLDLLPGDADARDALERLAVARGTQDRMQVSVLSGQSAGCLLEIADRVVLGLASTADLVLTDLGLSRQHARLTRLTDGRIQLEDLASANGTFVGDRRIDRCPLAVGDRFRLGCICDDGSLGIELQLRPITDSETPSAALAARLHCNRGLAKLRDGDLPGAIADCTEAIHLDGRGAEAYAARGAARLRMADPAGALADCSMALDLNPQAAHFYLGRAEVHLQQKDGAQAASDCDRAIELNPGLPAAWACRGEAKKLQGDLRGAVEDCTRALALRADLAKAWAIRAQAADALGNLGQASADYRKLLDLEPGNEMAEEGVRRLAFTSLPDLGELPEAAREKARAEVDGLIETEKRWGPDHPELATRLNRYANLLHVARAFRVAAPLFERAAAIMEQARGPEDLDLATFLNNLATALSSANMDAERARRVAGRALAIREKVLGPEHVDVAASLLTLANTQGNNAAARPIILRAVAIREKVRGAEHASVAQALDYLGRSYLNEGAYAAARPIYQRALDITESTLGSEHLDVVQCLVNLGETLYYSEAEETARVLDRALSLGERLQGPDHPDLARPLIFLGHVQTRANRLAQARELYARALSIREKRLPADHLDIAGSLRILADVHLKMGDPEAARPLYQRALALRIRVQGAQHGDVTGLQAHMGKLPAPRGKAALAAAEVGLDKLRLTKGAEHRDVASAMTRLADLHRLEGDVAQARALHERALAIREKVLGPRHPDVADSLNNLALLYFSAGDADKAAPLQERALAIRQQPPGPTPASQSEAGSLRVAEESPRLRAFLEAAVQLVHAERGLVLVTGEDGTLEVQAAVGIDRTTAGAPDSGIHQGFISRVAGEHRPLLGHNATQDPRFAAATSIVISGLRSVICVPLLHQDRLLGVVYLDSRLQRGAFKTSHLQQIEDHAAAVAGALTEDSTAPLQKVPGPSHVPLSPLHAELEATMRKVGAQRGVIVVPREGSEELDVRAAVGVEADSVWAVGEVSRVVLRRVAIERLAVLTHNALQDPRFEAIRSVVVSGLRSVMCLPLLQEEALVGVLYVDTAMQAGVFKTAQLDQLKEHASRLTDILLGKPVPAPLATIQACLEAAVGHVAAQRGVVLVPIAGSEDMDVRVAVGIDAQSAWAAINHSIVRQVSTAVQSVLSHSLQDQPVATVPSGLRSVMAFPLLYDSTVTGILYLDRPIPQGVFKATHLSELADYVDQLGHLLGPPLDEWHPRRADMRPT